ncbi:MAG: hypothetical protein N3B13_12265 [Deltaproteobacteria bacterium]|nr:hypothetical protein [Deltaproteobacteria bacterium]
MKKLLFSVFLFVLLYGCTDDSKDNELSDLGGDTGSKGCSTITDCSDKETRDYVCIKKGCAPIGEADKMLHIVFYPKYISSVVNNITYFRYFYFYPLDTLGNSINCEMLLNDYNFANKSNLNIVQTYEKQATISSTGSEMYTLPLPRIKDSLIFFIFYQDNGNVLAIGCAEKIDTTSNDAVGIFPCRPEQTNACLGQF